MTLASNIITFRCIDWQIIEFVFAPKRLLFQGSKVLRSSQLMILLRLFGISSQNDDIFINHMPIYQLNMRRNKTSSVSISSRARLLSNRWKDILRPNGQSIGVCVFKYGRAILPLHLTSKFMLILYSFCAIYFDQACQENSFSGTLHSIQTTSRHLQAFHIQRS